MRWLHISDLHFGYTSSTAANMREEILKLAGRIRQVDVLFITGDFLFGPSKTDDFKTDALFDEVKEYVWELQKALGIDKRDTFVVQGNHDGKRPSDEFDINRYEAAIRNYSPEIGDINSRALEEIQKNRAQFKKLYQQIRDEEELSGWHFCIPYHKGKCNYNIICLNTAMLCYKNDEQGNLILGTKFLDAMFSKAQEYKMPVIVLAHHPLEHIAMRDHEHFLSKLGKLETGNASNILYLCGHEHHASHKTRELSHNHTLRIFSCGGMMENKTNQGEPDMVIFEGEIHEENNTGYVQAHRWEFSIQRFLPDQRFSFSSEQDYALDGRWYFPERPDTEKPAMVRRRAYCDSLLQLCGNANLSGEINAGERAAYKRLAHVFVEPNLKPMPAENGVPQDETEKISRTKPEHMSVLFRDVPKCLHTLVLSRSGEGKSSLLQWLACAYALPLSSKPNDGEYNYRDIPKHGSLPKKNEWVPIWLPCKSIGNDCETLEEAIRLVLPREGHEGERLSQEVMDWVDKGDALILMDGVDESGNREQQLRIFSLLTQFFAEHQEANVVVSLRSEAWYALSQEERQRYGTLFKRYAIEPLDTEQIETLWKNLTLTSTDELSGDVHDNYKRWRPLWMDNYRYYAMAQNPFLLTILFLVYRRYHHQPDSRVLFREAMEALQERERAEMRSDGANGKKGMNFGELLRYLSFIAFHMTEANISCVSGEQLRGYLLEMQEQRRDLTPPDWEKDEGSLNDCLEYLKNGNAILRPYGVPGAWAGNRETLYEFRYKAFQEYLTAWSAVESYAPGCSIDDPPGEVLLSALDREHMTNAIIMAAEINLPFGQRVFRETLKALKTASNPTRQRHCRTILIRLLRNDVLLRNGDVKNALASVFPQFIPISEIKDVDEIRQGRYGSLMDEHLAHIGQSVYGNPYYWTPLMELLNGNIPSPYENYKQCGNDKIHALSLLACAFWLAHEKVSGLSEDLYPTGHISELKQDMLRVAGDSDADSTIRWQGFRVLMFMYSQPWRDFREFILSGTREAFFETPTEYARYRTALVSYINSVSLPCQYPETAIPPLRFEMLIPYADTQVANNVCFSEKALDNLLEHYGAIGANIAEIQNRFREAYSVAFLSALFHGEKHRVKKMFRLLGAWLDIIWKGDPKYFKMLDLQACTGLALRKGILQSEAYTQEEKDTVQTCIRSLDLAVLEHMEEIGQINDLCKTYFAEKYYPTLYPEVVSGAPNAEGIKALIAHLKSEGKNSTDDVQSG